MEMNNNRNTRHLLGGTVYRTKQTLLPVIAKAVFIGLIAWASFACPSTARAQTQPCDSIDIVLVLDVTGGMRHVVREIKSRAADIVDAAAEASSDVRLGLVTFTETVFVDQDLTSNLAAVEVALSRLRPQGGGAPPENWDGALNLAANRDDGFFYTGGPCFVSGTLSSFRPNCRKLVVLLTDAPPSGCSGEYVEGVDDIRAMGIADAAELNEVIVSTILSDNGDDAGEQALLEYCAAVTGGTFAIVPDRGPAGAIAIQDAITAQACPSQPSPPTVRITEPQDGDSIPSGTSVTFTGRAENYLGIDISATINWFLNESQNPFYIGASTDLVLADGVPTITAQATDENGTGSDAVTVTVGPPPTPSVVSVESISYATAAKGKHLKIMVSVEDGSGVPVSGAAVSIGLLRDGGLDLRASGITGDNGSVTFRRNNHRAGTYTTVVTDLSASGLTWDGATPPNEYVKY